MGCSTQTPLDALLCVVYEHVSGPQGDTDLICMSVSMNYHGYWYSETMLIHIDMLLCGVMPFCREGKCFQGRGCKLSVGGGAQSLKPDASTVLVARYLWSLADARHRVPRQCKNTAVFGSNAIIVASTLAAHKSQMIKSSTSGASARLGNT